MRILVVGAAGRHAGMVVPELKKQGAVVRALIRDPRQENLVRERGAPEIAFGDLEDADSLHAAVDEIDGVFHIGPAFAPNEIDMGITMVDVARSAGVRKFVFSSVIHPSLLALSNHAAKVPVEEALYESGMNFTILQPAMFMQNLEGGWEQVVRSARFALPYSVQACACYVDYRDVAEAVAIAFSTNRLDYGTFELCAPGMLNRIEVAVLMGQALGFPVKAEQVRFEDWADGVRLPLGPRREGMRRMYEHYDRHGFPGGNDLVLREILGREPRTLRQYIAELASSGRRMAA